jgi:hypothetical protein
MRSVIMTAILRFSPHSFSSAFVVAAFCALALTALSNPAVASSDEEQAVVVSQVIDVEGVSVPDDAAEPTSVPMATSPVSAMAIVPVLPQEMSLSLAPAESAWWPFRLQEHAEYYAKILGMKSHSFNQWAVRTVHTRLGTLLTPNELRQFTHILHHPEETSVRLSGEIEDLIIEELLSQLPAAVLENRQPSYNRERLYFLLRHPQDERYGRTFTHARRLVRATEMRKNAEEFVPAILSTLQREFAPERVVTEQDWIRLNVQEQDAIARESDIDALFAELLRIDQERARLRLVQSDSARNYRMAAHLEMVESVEDMVFPSGVDSGRFDPSALHLLVKLASRAKSSDAVEVKTWLVVLAGKHNAILSFILNFALDQRHPNALLANELIGMVSKKNPASLRQLRANVTQTYTSLGPAGVRIAGEQRALLSRIERTANPNRPAEGTCYRLLSAGQDDVYSPPKRLGPKSKK